MYQDLNHGCIMLDLLTFFLYYGCIMLDLLISLWFMLW